MFLTIVTCSIFIMMTGCSSYSDEIEKTYEIIRGYQEENSPYSNQILEIEYLSLSDIEEKDIIEIKISAGEDKFQIKGF